MTAADLSEIASVVLGDERAVELEAVLRERTGQLERVNRWAAAQSGVRGPSDVRARPAGGSVAAWAMCQQAIEAADRTLRAWAWTDATRPVADDVGARPGRRTLDGFVLGVKDVIDVAGMPTRSGSTLTSPEPVQSDATVTARARAAGAAIIGKTHCTEWALNDPAPTRSPWDAARTPGGSSAGSAVAVSVGMCTATVDTQTAGDVLRPAAYNGAVGLKPTIGWTPTDGTRAVAPSIDTIGVIAPSVGDAAAMATAIADQPDRFRSETNPRPPRLARLHNPFYDTVEPAAAANLDEIAHRFGDAGADIVDVATSVDLSLVHTAHRIMTFSECAAVHLSRYRSNPGRYGPKAREVLDLGLVTPAYAYVEAQHVRQEAGERLADLLKDVDALLLPLVPEPAPPRHTTGDSRFQIPWTLCGFPAAALPSGLTCGLPLSVQLVASPDDDATLLAAARWCEQTLDLVLRPGIPQATDRS